MTTKTRTKPTATPAPTVPPTWPHVQVATMTSRPRTTLHAREVYETLAAHHPGLVPTDVATAVERLGRAAALSVDLSGGLPQARNAYAAGVARFIDGEPTAPSLGQIEAAHLAAAAAAEALELVQSAQSQAEVDAAAAVRRHGAQIVESLRPRWEQVVADVEKVAAVIPSTVVNVGQVGANREHLGAWGDLLDAHQTWRTLTSIRSNMWLAYKSDWQPINDNRHLAEKLDRAPAPTEADAAGALLWFVRVRSRINLWWPTDDQLDLRQQASRPRALEADHRGRLREPSHGSGEVL